MVTLVDWAPKVVEDLVRRGVRAFYQGLELPCPHLHVFNPKADFFVYRDIVKRNTSEGMLDFTSTVSGLEGVTRGRNYRLIVVANGNHQKTIAQTSRVPHAAVLISLDRVLAAEGYDFVQTTEHELGHCLLNSGHHNKDKRDTAAWEEGKMDKGCIMATTYSTSTKFCKTCKERGKEMQKWDVAYGFV
ncbi:hypothetical protein CMO91_00920 [Candidatus Woesearchaeota archaeon]|nr:hypothetical protein [Candidatus Woesearchaeota archaeon]